MTQDADIKLIARTVNEDRLRVLAALSKTLPHTCCGGLGETAYITDYFKLIEWFMAQDISGNPTAGEFAHYEWSWRDCIEFLVAQLGDISADECKARLIKIIAAAIRENHD